MQPQQKIMVESERLQELLKLLLDCVSDVCATATPSGVKVNPTPPEVESTKKQKEKLLQDIHQTTKKWLQQLILLEAVSASETNMAQLESLQDPALQVYPQAASGRHRTAELPAKFLSSLSCAFPAVDLPHIKANLPPRMMQARQQLQSMKVATVAYRSDDGLRKVEDSIADVAPGPSDKATEYAKVVGTRESEYKPVLGHKGSVWNSGISAELEECIENLSCSLFNLPFSVSIGIPSITDTPLIGISDGFLKLSGYAREEIVGQNCRLLLKGVPKEEISAEVRQEARRYCRAAHLQNLTSMAHTFLLQRNARKNGDLFWNYFMLAIIPGLDERKCRYIIGLQLDLGPTLEVPLGQKWQADTHRKNLELVQKLMLGVKPEWPLDAKSKEATDSFLGLSEDILAWLTHAEIGSDAYQKLGTRPWVSWPAASKHALLNGGVSLLRLEADTCVQGATAMTIFPVAKKADNCQCSLKIRIDEVCEKWERAVQQKGKLPTMGFTAIKPSDMDCLGGLPIDLMATPESILLFGDGSAHVSADLHPPGFVARRSTSPASAAFAYEVTADDILECTWGKGFIKLEANGELLFQVNDPSIVGLPPTKPVFGIFDCCYSACRATLIV